MKPVILTFVRHYLPGYKSGGPQTSIQNLIYFLSDEFDFRVVCFDRDLGDTSPYETVRVNEWNTVNGQQVYYLPKDSAGYAEITRLINQTPHDVLYLNGIFSVATTLLPLVARRLGKIVKKPVIVAPRGSLSQGAMGLKPFRKIALLFVSKALGFYRNVIWQASTKMEQADIIQRLRPEQNKIKIARDLPAKIAEELPDRPFHTGPLRVVFLSRISPMKNLDYALQCLSYCTSRVIFNIYGPQEDAAYWALCQEKISALPSNIEVQVHGAVKPDQVSGILADNQLLFLPTRGENYGHVISEALNVGTPVLISDTTPWQEFPERVGIVLPLKDPIAFAKAIDAFADIPPQDFVDATEKTFAFARNAQLQNKETDNNRRLFNVRLSS